MATYISFIGKGQLVDKSKHQAGSSTDVSLPENRTAFEYGYKEVEYQFDEGKKTVKASLFTNAVIFSGLFREIDKVRIIGNYSSTWAQLLENPQTDEEMTLYFELMEAEQLPNRIKSLRTKLIDALKKRWNIADIDLVMHDAAYVGNEQQILEMYLNLMMKNKGDIILDVTHGLRWMPLFLTSSMELADALSLPRKVRILYGELTQRPSPVRILTPLWEERALSAALRLFLEKWEAEPLAQRVEPFWPTGATAIRDLGSHLQGNYLIPLVWDTDPGHYGRPFRQLNNAFSDLEKKEKKPLWLMILADYLKSLYTRITKQKTASGRILQLADLYAERRMYGQALLSQEIALRMFIWENNRLKDTDFPDWETLKEALTQYREHHKPLHKQFHNVLHNRNVVAHGALRSKGENGGIPQSYNLPSQFKAQQDYLTKLFKDKK